MKAQITLTVNESKRLMAKAIISLPEVKDASEKGNILLKGGTIVFQRAFSMCIFER